MVRRYFCMLIWLALVMSAAFPAAAQDTPLVDATFRGRYAVSVPQGWQVWRRENFAGFDAASAALNVMLGTLNPAYTPLITRETRLAAFPLDASAGDVLLTVETVGRGPLGAMTATLPEAVTPDVVLALLGAESGVQTASVNGRPAAWIVTETGGAAAVVFEEQDVIGIVVMNAPDPALVAQVLASLRLDGEEAGTFAAASADGSTCTLTAITDARVRIGPSTEFNQLSSIQAGLTATATGQGPGFDGRLWYRLDNDGWIRSDVVRPGADCDALPDVTFE